MSSVCGFGAIDRSGWRVSRLKEVAWEFIVADEALRKALIKSERQTAHIKRLLHLMRPANPDRITINGEVHSVPLGMTAATYLKRMRRNMALPSTDKSGAA